MSSELEFELEAKLNRPARARNEVHGSYLQGAGAVKTGLSIVAALGSEVLGLLIGLLRSSGKAYLERWISFTAQPVQTRCRCGVSVSAFQLW